MHNIMSTGGRVQLKQRNIPPYPKMLHAKAIEEPMIAQLKVNGYNVHLVMDDVLYPILRGGAFDQKTQELLLHYLPDEFTAFFTDHPKSILCIEIIGKKTMATYKGNSDVEYYVFDIMDEGRHEEDRFLIFDAVQQLCTDYHLQCIPSLGRFHSLDELNKKLVDVPIHFEGVVLKSLDGKRFLKYKWEDCPLFHDRVVRKEKTWVERDETIVVSHFFQGYEEKELGLERGMTQEELQKYSAMIEELSRVERSTLGQASSAIVARLLSWILDRGSFSAPMEKKIEKELKGKVGKEIGKIMKRNIQ